MYSLGATLYVCTRVSNPRELSDESRELLNWMVEGSHSRRIELDAVERAASARLRNVLPNAANGSVTFRSLLNLFVEKRLDSYITDKVLQFGGNIKF